MKSLIYQKNRAFQTIELEEQSLDLACVRIAVEYVGLCGTDLHIFHGDMDTRVGENRVIGHEMAGVVAQVASDCDELTIGQKVTVMPTRFCGECKACLTGTSHVCHEMNFLGIDSDGALQTHWDVPKDLVFVLPQDMDTKTAALIEPLAVAIHDVNRAMVGEKDFVVVTGGGPVGTLIAYVAQQRGATVVLSEVDDFRISLAQSLGLDVINPLETNFLQYVRSRNYGEGANIAFEVSGAQEGMTAALGALGTRGRMVLVAIHPEERSVNLHSIFWKELEIFGARLYTAQDFEQSIAFLTEHSDFLDQLITHVVSPTEVESGFAALESGVGVMKMLISIKDLEGL